MLLRLPILAAALGAMAVPASALPVRLLQPLSWADGGPDSGVYDPDSMASFEVGDTVYLMVEQAMIVHTAAGIRHCDADFTKPGTPVDCGGLQLTLEITGARQRLEQTSEQFNNRDGSPARLTIVAAGRREVLNGWWVEYLHSN